MDYATRGIRLNELYKVKLNLTKRQNNMNLSKRFFLSLIAACLLAVPMFSQADTVSQPQKEEVSTGELSLDAQMAQNGANYSTSHNRSNHIYVGTTIYADQIEIEDGTYFLTNPNQRAMLIDWLPGDTLLLLQNEGSFWSKPAYPYVVLNTRTNQRLEVEISAAPLWDLRFYVIEIYKPVYGDGWLKLNDGSSWKLYSGDRDTWNLWEPNDSVIIGTYDSFWNFWIPNILLNVTCSQRYVKSVCTN